MVLDFTLGKYKELCDAISKSSYKQLTIKEYLSMKIKPEKFIIIRHDIDSEPDYALKMAKLENEMNICSTYYFRHVEGIFLPELIHSVADLGHEIGYHYEVVDKALGNYELAINLFTKELTDFREICNIETIAQHGSPLIGNISATSFSGIYKLIKNHIEKKDMFTKWVNVDIWKRYNYSDFNIIGEAYLSFDFDKIIYLSDTGRNWNPTKYKFRDIVSTNLSQPSINSTEGIIEIIKSEQINSLYLLTHPNQWKEHFDEWIKWLFFQYIRNTGKTLLKYKRRV